MLIGFQADNRYFRTTQSGHGGAEYTNGSRTENNHTISRFNIRIASSGIVCNATGFCKAGMFKRKIVGNLM